MSAINIFALSPKCRKMHRIPKHNAKWIRRLDVICQFVTTQYRTPRDTIPIILRKLAEQDDVIKGWTVTTESGSLRVAYAYLNKEELERPSITELREEAQTDKNRGKELAPLINLLEDGITTWEQVETLEKERIAKQEETARLSESTDLADEAVIKPINAEQEKMSENETPELTRQISASYMQIAQAVEVVLGETERLDRLAAHLTEQNHLLAEHSARLIEENQFFRNELLVYKLRVQRLEQQKEQTDAQQIEEIAFRNKQVLAPLLKCAEQLEDRNKKYLTLRENLPKKARWYGDPSNNERSREITIDYFPPVYKFYDNTDNDDHRRALEKQIRVLCAQGPKYKSLHTKKNARPLCNTPANVFYSRAGIDLRFTWGLIHDVLCVYDFGYEKDVFTILRSH